MLKRPSVRGSIVVAPRPRRRRCALCALAAALAFFRLAASAHAACEDPAAQGVRASLARAEQFSRTTGSSSKDVQDIADARRRLSASGCALVALFVAQTAAAQIYLSAGDARGVDELAAACRLAEQASDPDHWDWEFACKRALLVGLIELGRFDEAHAVTASLQSLVGEHGQDAAGLLADIARELASATIRGQNDKARAYAQVMDAFGSAPVVGPVLAIDKAVHAAERHLFIGEYAAALADAAEAHRRLERDPTSKRDLIALNVLWVRAQAHLALNEPDNALTVLREGEGLITEILGRAGSGSQESKIANFYVANFYAALTKVYLILGQKPQAQAALGRSTSALAAAGLEGTGYLLGLPRMAAQLNPERAAAILPTSGDLVGQWVMQLRQGSLDAASVRLVSELAENPGLTAMSSREDRIQFHAALGQALAASDDLAAIEAYVKAIDLIEDGRIQAIGASEALPSFFSQYVDIYDGLIGVLQAKVRSDASAAVPTDLRRFGNSYAEMALYFAEAAHARAFAERYGPKLVEAYAIRTGIPPAKRERRRELLARIGEASDPGFAARIDDDRLAARQRSEQATHAYVAFLDSLKADYPDFAELAFPRPIALAQLPPRLNGRFIVEYKVTDQAVEWWLIRDRKIVAFDRSVIGRADLIDAVGHFLDRIDDDDSVPFAPRDALRDALVRGPFTKIESMAPPGVVPRVVIVPDEVLYLMPWEALPAPHRGRLGEQFIVSYAPSLTVLAQAVKASSSAAPRKTALVLGNTLAEDIQIDGFALKFKKLGRDEADKIDAMLEHSGYQTVLVAGPPGPPATRHYLFDSRSAQYAIIHIDTHGLAGHREPPPGILLGPDPSSTYHYDLVTLSDLAALNLRARLVTLSACQSALGSGLSRFQPRHGVFSRLADSGNAIAGEGVLSVARMFMLGGARDVLASLDFAAPDAALALWQAMYDELGSGRAPDVATALFRAKAALRARPGMDKPSKWSVFILIGDPSS